MVQSEVNKQLPALCDVMSDHKHKGQTLHKVPTKHAQLSNNQTSILPISESGLETLLVHEPQTPNHSSL